MRAVLRRQRVDRDAGGVAEAGGVRLECAARQARVEGASVDLTAVEFDLLEHLVRHAGRKVLRDDLTRAAWGRQASPLDRSLDVHISRLRRKIRAGARIVTMRGVGYMLAVPPARASGDAAASTTPEW
jgi:two-component system response regulator CpxR